MECQTEYQNSVYTFKINTKLEKNNFAISALTSNTMVAYCQITKNQTFQYAGQI